MDDCANDGDMNLDTAVAALNNAYSLENWTLLIRRSDQLCNDAYQSFIHNIQAQKPIIYYIGYSLLMKGIGYQKDKQYGESLRCIDQYKDLRRFLDGSERSQRILDQYAFYAYANSLSVHLLSGNLTKLDEYAQFLNQHPSETLSGLLTLLECALSQELNVDEYIAPLTERFDAYQHDDMRPEEQTIYLSILMMLSRYCRNRKRFEEAQKYTQQFLSLSFDRGPGRQASTSAAPHE
ncbi:hypothetical protein [Paenibacillus sp. PSB04]|uniref:hypothetical protein n=1 Tax=Paenibacillus sp. PSB04 TaxID=2866810 RepID=UPI0021F23DD9|nr:hypothetical protein [Paenibacillus sp. PSB04]UYO01931.1 hypothetical protein K2F33_19270 [Paenibacillus sp. PSB04]